MASPAHCLILDFDRSVLPLPASRRLDLTAWREDIGFACGRNSLVRLRDSLAAAGEPEAAVTFLGSGDYHHVSFLLLQRWRQLGRPVRVVVFDNHPDNMRTPFGIHCGSWVWHASQLPCVAGIDVLGITSTDVECAHAWENHWRNLKAGKVRYWCIGRDLGWMRRLGMRDSESFPSAAVLLDAFQRHFEASDEPVYLSIDKDVLSIEDVHTNWDQGVFRTEELLAAVAFLRRRVIAADVVGEVSQGQYRSRFKRWLQKLDRPPEIPPALLEPWQEQHRRINLKLLDALSGCGVTD